MIGIMTRYGTVFLLLFCLSGCSPAKMPELNPSNAGKITPALAYWQSENSYAPITWIETDLDNDSLLDTVLIYRKAEDECMLCAILNTHDGFVISQSTRAPLENQIIRSKDIDSKPPVEVMVSGSKNGKFGYGIFRLDNNQLIDLFAEGMNDCC